MTSIQEQVDVLSGLAGRVPVDLLSQVADQEVPGEVATTDSEIYYVAGQIPHVVGQSAPATQEITAALDTARHKLADATKAFQLYRTSITEAATSCAEAVAAIKATAAYHGHG